MMTSRQFAPRSKFYYLHAPPWPDYPSPWTCYAHDTSPAHNSNLFLDVDGCRITPSTEVSCNLSVILDSTLSFQAHIKNTTKSAIFHLPLPSLALSVTETFIHSFLTSRLDYCNTVLYGLPSKALDRLQNVQNSAATALIHTKPWQHITPTLKQLHWLAVKSFITLTSHTQNTHNISYKSLYALALQNLSDLFHPFSQ